jgi:glycosyltransferase involved in cell wall biosynthesis
MISFIIATKFKSPFVGKLIELIITESGPNSELILINQTDRRLDKLVAPNLKVIEAGQDNGKNQAWNIGVERATKKYICLVDDDILFNVLGFVRSVKEMNPAEINLVGVNNSSFVEQGINTTKDVIRLGASDQFVNTGFGSMMLMHRSTWFKIPADIKEYYAANLLFFYFKNSLKKTVHTFDGLKIMSIKDSKTQQIPKGNPDTKGYQAAIESLTSKSNNINLF